ncbi:hypothetical protein EE36_01100 [Sulfitobacter sp. EE-36]|nr:hypothetical protein EE36_01100 [Sulfitobacter sp. EE-36]
MKADADNVNGAKIADKFGHALILNLQPV